MDESHSQIFVEVTEVLIKHFTDVLTGSDGMGTLIRPTVLKREGEGCLKISSKQCLKKERLQRKKESGSNENYTSVNPPTGATPVISLETS